MHGIELLIYYISYINCSHGIVTPNTTPPKDEGMIKFWWGKILIIPDYLAKGYVDESVIARTDSQGGTYLRTSSNWPQPTTPKLCKRWHLMGWAHTGYKVLLNKEADRTLSHSHSQIEPQETITITGNQILDRVTQVKQTGQKLHVSAQIRKAIGQFKLWAIYSYTAYVNLYSFVSKPQATNWSKILSQIILNMVRICFEILHFCLEL